mmetsp:Transcript_30571/g.79247  ORF Transcript_30571/g.79247 Transcript_30571/m.79247 type:complete len:178 (+) Transcript_30571:16-549(+)
MAVWRKPPEVEGLDRRLERCEAVLGQGQVSDAPAKLRQLQETTERLLGPEGVACEKDLAEVRDWLETDAGGASSLHGSVAAKRAYVLASADRLRATAKQLEEFSALKEYAKAPAVDLEGLGKRLAGVELRGAEIASQALDLQQQLEEMVTNYQHVMQHMSQHFLECDAKVSRQQAPS